MLPTHLWCSHFAWIICTAEHCLYCSPVYVHLYFKTWKLMLTNESPSKITFMNRVDQSQINDGSKRPNLWGFCYV